jgi:hypothetical protein
MRMDFKEATHRRRNNSNKVPLLENDYMNKWKNLLINNYKDMDIILIWTNKVIFIKKYSIS